MDIDNWISQNFNEYYKWLSPQVNNAYVAYINGVLFIDKDRKIVFSKKEKLFSALKRSALFEVIKCKLYKNFDGSIKNKEKQSTKLTHDIFKELIHKGIITIVDIKSNKFLK